MRDAMEPSEMEEGKEKDNIISWEQKPGCTMLGFALCNIATEVNIEAFCEKAISKILKEYM